MDKETTRQLAVAYIEKRRNCAEAVFLAVGESLGQAPEALPVYLATAFAGGVGKTRKELCGALAGGVMAVGGQCGHDTTCRDGSMAASLAEVLRDRFVERFTASRCQTVLDELGPQEDFDKCKALTGETAVLVLEVLDEAGLIPSV